jgi:hypothetical protein
LKSPTSSSSLDPIPTWLLKKCLPELSPILTKIVNLSLMQGYFPTALKQAHITPLIKKPSLDPESLKNYRPVANLKFLAKTVERACSSQIQNYLSDNNLYGKMQSAYRANHSTESALLRVYNDLLLAADKGQEAILVLLDYSAAFDTINHEVFFQRLSNRYGISGLALDWFKTYFSDRSQTVVIDGKKSSLHVPEEGVPQGSVIGPLSFTLYSSPLEDIIDAHGIGKMLYADDTQVYVVLNNKDQAACISKLELCIKDIKSWSISNYLKLNEDKTEVMHISSCFRTTTPVSSINIDDISVDTVSNARNLGIIFENNLKLDTHVNNICRAASFALYKIGKIRQYLDMSTTEKLIHAFVSCRLDNCNSLLYGLPDSKISKLQRIQNSAARLVTRSKSRDHITPILHDLHWLPVKYRIIYKTLVLTFKCIHGLAPVYLQELVQLYQPTCCLRSYFISLLASTVLQLQLDYNRSTSIYVFII